MTIKTKDALTVLLRHATNAVAAHKAIAAVDDASATDTTDYKEEAARLLNELELAIALNYYKDLLIAAAEWNATTVEGGIRAMRNRIFSFFKQDPRNVAAFGAAFRETLSDAEAYMFATAYEEWCRQFPTWKLPECYLTDVNNVLYIEAIQTVAARSDELEADAEADAEDAPDEQQDAGMPGEENQ